MNWVIYPHSNVDILYSSTNLNKRKWLINRLLNMFTTCLNE